MQPFKEKVLGILRWTEQHTKTDMVYLTKGGFWLFAGYLAQAVSGLVLVIAFTNLVSKETYGTYQFVMSGAAILTAFTLSGMWNALSRSVAKGSDGVLPYAFKKQFTWNIGIVIAGIVTAVYYFIKNDISLAIAFLIAGAFEALISGFSLYKPFLIGKERFKESTMLGLWRKPLPVIAMLISLFFTNDPVVLVFIYFVTNAISTGLLYLLVRRRYPAPLTEDTELVSYSKHLSIAGLANRITANVDTIVVFHFLGATAAATYGLALFPISHFDSIFGLTGSLVLPKFARQNLSALRESLPRKALLFLLFIIATVVLYIALAPYVFGALFPAYPEAVALTQLMVLAILMKPRALFEHVFVAQGMKGSLHITRTSTAILKVVLLLTLVPLYGLSGAVGALIATHLYAAIITAILFYLHAK
ncbi:MAG: oligosaccharide flippase family protein [Candidatus Pacebacteria bacterium]|nr:oligosaccharide flippase family protein [Candidatus Paceibacterota bacterium]